jgi:hypothetical protein
VHVTAIESVDKQPGGSSVQTYRYDPAPPVEGPFSANRKDWPRSMVGGETLRVPIVGLEWTVNTSVPLVAAPPNESTTETDIEYTPGSGGEQLKESEETEGHPAGIPVQLKTSPPDPPVEAVEKVTGWPRSTEPTGLEVGVVSDGPVRTV